ncbi:uncharacterized protein V6R79_023413 [Siganus canaliculatus]
MFASDATVLGASLLDTVCNVIVTSVSVVLEGICPVNLFRCQSTVPVVKKKLDGAGNWPISLIQHLFKMLGVSHFSSLAAFKAGRGKGSAFEIQDPGLYLYMKSPLMRVTLAFDVGEHDKQKQRLFSSAENSSLTPALKDPESIERAASMKHPTSTLQCCTLKGAQLLKHSLITQFIILTSLAASNTQSFAAQSLLYVATPS